MHPSLITTSQRTTIMRKSCLGNQFPAGVLNFDKQDEEIKLYKQDDKKDISQRTAIMVKHNHVEKKHKNRWPAGVLKLDKKDDTKGISEIGMMHCACHTASWLHCVSRGESCIDIMRRMLIEGEIGWTATQNSRVSNRGCCHGMLANIPALFPFGFLGS